MKTLIGVMMKLIQSEVCETPLDESIKEYLTEEFLEKLYRISKCHDLAHIVGSALDGAGLLPEGELAEKFRSQCFTAVFRYERMKYEYERICETLEKAGVDFMPLKGPIIRAYYAKPWQRTSCDIDILVHEEVVDETARMLCEKMGFAADGDRGYHDISLRSSDGIHLELHFSIKENLENVDSTLIRVWEYARPVEGWKHQYCQTPEFFVFHSLAHMSYHFIFGGCGLRPMIDFYLIRTKMEYNVEEVRALCRQCKIETFFDRLNELIDALFEGKNHTTMTLRMLTYLINGGVYGTQVNRIAVQQSRKGSKIRYLMYRIFMPYEELIIHYPVLERHRWLMPICWVRRWFRLFRVRTLKSSVRELRAANAVTDDQARVIGELLGDLKLL